MVLCIIHLLTRLVNAILGDHNVDKQMTDSRGDVNTIHLRLGIILTPT